jgi:hypothetical protein
LLALIKSETRQYRKTLSRAHEATKTEQNGWIV